MNNRLPQSNGIAISLPSPKRTKTLSILALLLLATGIGHAQTASQRYLDDIKHLTVPSMEGRGDGTKGLTRAAHLIEQRYKRLGLEPAGAQSYFQPFAVVTGARLKADNFLRVQDGQAKTALKLNKDFVPFSFSSSASPPALSYSQVMALPQPSSAMTTTQTST